MIKNYSKKSVAFAVTLFFTSMVSAQWVAKSPLPGAGSVRDGAVSWLIGNKWYVAGGNGHSDLLEYDPNTDAWTPKAPIPQGITMFAMGFAVNGKGYLVGGVNSSFVYKSAVWEYDPVLNQWTAKAPFIAGKYADGFGMTIGNKGYILCGDDSLYAYANVYEYDPVTDNWTTKAPFIGGARLWPYGFAIGSKGYLGGGSQATEVNDFWEFDPVLNSWTAKSPIPGNARQCAASFSSDAKGYVGLGQAGFSTTFSDVYEYDPADDEWIALPSFIGGRAWPVGFAYGNEIFFSTGWNFTTFFHDLYAFTVTTGIDQAGNLPVEIISYPGRTSITFHFTGISAASLSLSDAAGRIVARCEIFNRTEYSVPVADLPKGIYFIQIISKDNQKRLVRKIVFS